MHVGIWIKIQKVVKDINNVTFHQRKSISRRVAKGEAKGAVAPSPNFFEKIDFNNKDSHLTIAPKKFAPQRKSILSYWASLIEFREQTHTKEETQVGFSQYNKWTVNLRRFQQTLKEWNIKRWEVGRCIINSCTATSIVVRQRDYPTVLEISRHQFQV